MFWKLFGFFAALFAIWQIVEGERLVAGIDVVGCIVAFATHDILRAIERKDGR